MRRSARFRAELTQFLLLRFKPFLENGVLPYNFSPREGLVFSYTEAAADSKARQ
jgi:hypothetical protein